MKKITTTTIALLIAAFSVTNLQAQTDHVLAEGHSTLFPADKTYENVTPAETRSARLLPAEVSTKAVRSFKNYFSNIESPAWYAANGGYLAKFSNEGMSVSALFSKEGRMLHSVSYGTEKDLPNDIRRAIKAGYEDYKIGVASQVYAMHQQAWVVNLESYGKWIIVRYMDGQLDELKNFSKN